jgi:manganese oxidase
MSKSTLAAKGQWSIFKYLCVPSALCLLLLSGPSVAQIVCERQVTADVVAFDMPLMWNRIGAQNINGMMFALRRDTINLDSGLPLTEGGAAVPGRVALRPDKRPRPLVLRMGAGDCLTYTVTNLLTPAANPFNAVEERSGIDFNLDINNQVEDRRVSLRFQGTQLVNSTDDDGSFVGQNNSSLIAPGASRTYSIYAPKESTYLGTSYGTQIGGEGLGGNTAGGLFAVLNVGPKGAAYYRSQLTREEMDLASGGSSTANGQPIVDYDASYPTGEPWVSEGKAGLPLLNMIDVSSGSEIVHSDINAIVVYGGSDFIMDGNGRFPAATYPLESVNRRNPTVPNRLEPFREFSVVFHDEVATKQAFPEWFEDPVLQHTLHGVRDSFMINYGSGGIGSEIIASRLRIGPMHDCLNCAYEEFFLTSFAVSDVGQLVDIPANFGLEDCKPTLAGCEETGPKANYALFPDDPSNVHHSYTGDFVKFRNVHAGPGEQHVFHLHNHQWLFNANDDNSNYLDAQGIGPGSGYTYEINFGGSGNRNKTAGDAIFHCHFYPHFAQGMWEMWRIHDVFEEGTELQATVDGEGVHTSFVVDGIGVGDGTPAQGARALPDGEILAGTPIPAVVPLPGKAMAPMPVDGVTVKPNPSTVCLDPAAGLVAKQAGVCPVGTQERSTGSLADVPRVPHPEFGLENPGYPFWIAGMEHTVGQRPTTPPLDMITQAKAQALANGPDPLWDHPGFADPASIQGWDGGLPRFSLAGFAAGGQAIVSVAEVRLDLSKEIVKARPFFYPEEGTDLEQAAMAYHAKRNHPTFLSDGVGGTAGSFVLNGALPVAGAPYNEPCIDDRGVLMTSSNQYRFFSASLTTDPYSTTAMGTRGGSPFNAATPRVYKAAQVQFDAVFNKLGYHFPQQRVITLWQDVEPTVLQQRPPEPFVLRMNTFDCTQYVLANTVPKTYELDDYQIRTPTDVLGQHIHLPKWDLTAADGSANGWNYEDASLSPQIVIELIEAINAYNADPANSPVLLDVEGNPVVSSDGHSLTASGVLEPSEHPFFSQFTQFGNCPNGPWCGARSTMQRWFADPVVNVQGVDRGLGIIFTHDHLGPSTHQQLGLYATVLIEPAGSKWVHNETGEQFYTRTGTAVDADGGPTSWQAAILTGSYGVPGYNQNVKAEFIESSREFYLEYADFQHAYQPGVYVGADVNGFPLDQYQFVDSGIVVGGPGQTMNAVLMAGQGALSPDPGSFRDAIQPSFRQQAPLTASSFPVDIWIFPPFCPGDVGAGGTANVPRPCPEAISADDPGMYVVNYRNESLMARVYDPNRQDCPDGKPGCQAEGRAGDLAFAMLTRTDRQIPALNTELGNTPPGYAGDPMSSLFLPPINQLSAVEPGDPFTPLLRAFDGDLVHVKMQAGGQEEEHTGTIHGLKWLQGGSGFGTSLNTGWRSAQPNGISEQFTLTMPVFADLSQDGGIADYAYAVNSSIDGWVNGTWGVIRSYQANRTDLFPLPENHPGTPRTIKNPTDFREIWIDNEDGDILGTLRGVCPNWAPFEINEITAVRANDVLPKQNANVVMIQDLFPGAHMGRAPFANDRTLIYNSRQTGVAGQSSSNPPQAGNRRGPLHDPTAILYVYTDDLIPLWPYSDTPENRRNPLVPVKLRDGVPVEPLVVRANAGDCVRVYLTNRLLRPAFRKADYGPVYDANGKRVFECSANMYEDPYGTTPIAPADVQCDTMPDLASTSPVPATVRRDRNAPEGMTSFNNNLIAPSAHVGLHPGLVEYDVTRSDGANVGLNGTKTVPPGRMRRYQWYAGHIEQEFEISPFGPPNRRTLKLEAHPIEFGGFNLSPADVIKQPQKGALGAGVVYPQYLWSMVVKPGRPTEAAFWESQYGPRIEDFTTIAQKGASFYYANSFPVENVEGEGNFGVAEDSQDMGHMAINYATEPMWFRFGLNPTDDEGLANLANAGNAYSNALVGGDPETPVFTVEAGLEFRQHVLMAAGPGRGSTFDLHGHVWQRDPYVCRGSSELGLPGNCKIGNGVAAWMGTGEVGSRNLGHNPLSFYLGGIESWFPGEHYEVLIPRAGGDNAIRGDYLFRDHMGLGNNGGLWGIIRVEEPW